MRADDVAYSDQSRRQRRRGPRHAALVRDVADGRAIEIEMMYHRLWKSKKAVHVFAEDLQALVVGQNLNQAAEGHGPENEPRRVGFLRAGADDFNARDAFRPGQRLIGE